VSPKDGSTAIKPDLVSTMTTYISADLKTEYSTLQTQASNWNKSNTQVYGMSNAHGSGATNWNTFSSGMTSAQTSFNSIYKTFNTSDIKGDALTKFKPIMIIVIWALGFTTIG